MPSISSCSVKPLGDVLMDIHQERLWQQHRQQVLPRALQWPQGHQWEHLQGQQDRKLLEEVERRYLANSY